MLRVQTMPARLAVCNAGYDGDGVECTNIDECADPTLNNCDTNASCTDDAGSFSCVCNAGYDGDGVECTNIDPALNAIRMLRVQMMTDHSAAYVMPATTVMVLRVPISTNARTQR